MIRLTTRYIIKLLTLILIFISSFCFISKVVAGDGSGIYWVSTIGSSTWTNCESVTSLIDTNCCSLLTANRYAVAGDTVNLRGGTYANHAIHPANSGTQGNIITFQAYGTETPIITGNDSGAFGNGIFLDNVDYIKIDGITSKDTVRLGSIRNWSDYNEITNCTFTDTDGVVLPFYLWGQCAGGASTTCPSTNNWIHNSTFYHAGYVSGSGASCNDESGLMYIGTPTTGDYMSDNNTIENNVFYSGGHHLIETSTKENVVRNNVFHNENWMARPDPVCTLLAGDGGLYGNRCATITDGHNQGNQFNLWEGNRIGHAGIAPDDNGSDNLTIAAAGNIVRYNSMFNATGHGIYLRAASYAVSSNNRIYNNTLNHNGYASQARTDVFRQGIWIHANSLDNAFKNNLTYDSYSDDCYHSVVGDTDCELSTSNIYTNNFETADGNPLFINTNNATPANTATEPNLNLQSNSPAIDQGVNLTQANGAGNSSITLIVDDALYFQDGSLGSVISNIQADWIAIGTVDNVVQIRSINYSINVITLATSATWVDDARIWLYRNSSGQSVLYDSAPDQGAYEYKKEFLRTPLYFSLKQ